MLDALKYLPLEWRKSDERCTPGPRYRRRQRVPFLVGGNTVSLDLPPHRPSDQDIYRGETPKRGADQLNRRYRSSPNDTEPYSNWKQRSVLSRRWAFWGPWMKGHKGDLHLYANIVSSSDAQGAEAPNLFHPENFEDTLRRYFADTYGHERKLNNAPWWVGPINWTPKSTLAIVSATCEFEKQAPPLREGLNDHLLLFPVTPRHFVKVVAKVFINSVDAQELPLFDTTPIRALRGSIFDSVRVELSEESERQINALKKESREWGLSANFESSQAFSSSHTGVVT